MTWLRRAASIAAGRDFPRRFVEPLSRDPSRSRDRRHAARPGRSFERFDDVGRFAALECIGQERSLRFRIGREFHRIKWQCI